MKLEKLRELAEARTKGEWLAGERYNLITPDGEQSPMPIAEDRKFIAAFANHADALLDAVEAAKNFCDRCQHKCPNPSACWICDMNKALSKLESI